MSPLKLLKGGDAAESLLPCDEPITVVRVPVDNSPAADARERHAPSDRVGHAAIVCLSFVLVWLVTGLAWEILTAKGWLNGRVLVPPSSFVPYVLDGSASAGIGYDRITFPMAILDTLLRVFVGFALGLAAALLFAVLICALPALRLTLLPIARTMAPIAPVAWIPLAITVVGIGSGAAVFVVFLGIVGSVTVAAVAALDDVPDEYRKVARLLGARGASFWCRVMLPAAAPALVTTMRMSFFGAWMAVLAGEMAGINSGLGALIILGQQQFNMKLVMGGIVTIGLLGFAVDQLLAFAGRRIVWWDKRRPGWGRPA